ncbi:MAG: diguanylate cyclase [Gammaproteobacteria bacterium]|nr:MAG: diguanylate cyclase [Gammaproteobacteria bacterium]
MLPRLDARQRLRLRRFKMAMAAYIMWVSLGVFAFVTDNLDISKEVLFVVLGGIALTNLYFYIMIRSGLNKRINDPSMTAQQITLAFCWVLVLMVASSEVRGAMMMVYVVTLLFGIFRLNRRGFFAMTAFALIGYLAVVFADYKLFPERFDASQEALRTMVLTASLLWCSWFASYVARLKESLRIRNTELREAVTSTSRMATRDHLTQSFNRRYMMECLSREKTRAERTGSNFSVCIFDLDHFKKLNDKYGHLVGDQVLTAFAYLARQALRATDVIDLDGEGRCFGRFGGEEFICLLPSTEEEGARKCAERLRRETAESEFEDGVVVTLSAGVAEFVPGESVADTLQRADEALYVAKQTGRNRVSCASGMTAPEIEAEDSTDRDDDVVVRGVFNRNSSGS